MDADAALLQDYINEDRPFGPISSDHITDPKVMDILFDRENRIYSDLLARPSIIIGRKGAGKTSFLRSVRLDQKYKVVAELKTHRAFVEVLQQIESRAHEPIFVEGVAEVWETVLWATLFRELLSQRRSDASDELNRMRSFLAARGLDGAQSSEEVVRAIVAAITDGGLQRAAAGRLQATEVGFADAREAACRVLRTFKWRAAVLIDSMENFALDHQRVRHALAGLLNCIARFRAADCVAEVRFCLPSELEPEIRALSESQAKDFEHGVVIHWRAGELVQIAAHRLAIFLRLHHPDFCRQRRIAELDLNTHVGAARFLGSVLPPTVVNALGQEEHTVAYLMRHTQLLPRQLLLILNRIMLTNRRLGHRFTAVDADAVKQGIYATEHEITNEIFSAYRHVCPEARAACERCLPHLGFRFSAGELHTVFNRHGRKRSALEFDEFKAMLLRIGCIGKVIGESERYVQGVFEYTLPHQLRISTDDELCLHPVFCQVFSARYSNGDRRVVYPYGSDLHGDESGSWPMTVSF